MNIGSLIASSLRRMQMKRRLQSEARALAELDDRLLHDIGVDRAQVRDMLVAAFGKTRARTLAPSPWPQARSVALVSDGRDATV